MDAYLSLAEQLTSETSIENEIGHRATKSAKMRTIQLPEGAFDHQTGLFNEGTIVTVIGYGTGGAEYLDGFARAVAGKNNKQIQLHCEAIIARTKKDSKRTPKANAFEDMPTIVDVLYGNTWLAKHLLIGSDTQLALSTAIWSGGKLNDKNFRATEHASKRAKNAEVQVMTILVPPRLNKVEKAVLGAVPDDLSEVHVKGPSVSWSAAGLAVKWTAQKPGTAAGRQLVDLSQIFTPLYERIQDVTTVNQRQQQQENTKQQQQQQNVHQQDGQNVQQQQQQQAQDGTQRQQQQQVQQQQAQTNQNQDQNQQDQQANTQQQQNDQNDQHAAACEAQHQGSGLRDDLDGGLAVLRFDEQEYATLLSRIDFESLDATQSVKELLRLRERLITVGMG